MVSHHQAPADHLAVKDEQSHLLKLPPELRNRIYELILAPAMLFTLTTYGMQCRPGLLRVCRQIRAETRLVCYYLRKFYIIVTAENMDNIRRWAATITDDELRSIQSLTLQFQTGPRRPRYSAGSSWEGPVPDPAISEFGEMVSSLEQRYGAGNITKEPVAPLEPRDAPGDR